MVKTIKGICRYDNIENKGKSKMWSTSLNYEYWQDGFYFGRQAKDAKTLVHFNKCYVTHFFLLTLFHDSMYLMETFSNILITNVEFSFAKILWDAVFFSL